MMFLNSFCRFDQKYNDAISDQPTYYYNFTCLEPYWEILGSVIFLRTSHVLPRPRANIPQLTALAFGK